MGIQKCCCENIPQPVTDLKSFTLNLQALPFAQALLLNKSLQGHSLFTITLWLVESNLTFTVIVLVMFYGHLKRKQAAMFQFLLHHLPILHCFIKAAEGELPYIMLIPATIREQYMCVIPKSITESLVLIF